MVNIRTILDHVNGTEPGYEYLWIFCLIFIIVIFVLWQISISQRKKQRKEITMLKIMVADWKRRYTSISKKMDRIALESKREALLRRDEVNELVE
jgi:hypothetical protein|tara:strand:+ start:765 stop:1049 length:285 start_codon:yes stop_codon:yes gene_type:complete